MDDGTLPQGAKGYLTEAVRLSQAVIWAQRTGGTWEFDNTGDEVADGSSWFFVLNYPRTGSTVVTELLNRHPDVYCGNEHQVLPLLMAILGSRYFLAPSLHFAVRYKKQIDITPLNMRYLLDGWRKCVSAKPVFGDKGEMYFGRFGDACRQVFPGCKLILTVRHPLDVLSSYINQSWAAHLYLGDGGNALYTNLRSEAQYMLTTNARWRDHALVIEFERTGGSRAGFEESFTRVFRHLGVRSERYPWQGAWEACRHRSSMGRWQDDEVITSFLRWLQDDDQELAALLESGSYYGVADGL